MVEGEALAELLDELAHVASRLRQQAYRLRIAVDGGQLKLKVNEETWTPPLGAVTIGEGAR